MQKYITCTCKHTFQDEQNGTNQRSFTTTTQEPTKETVVVRCTVCTKEQTIKK